MEFLVGTSSNKERKILREGCSCLIIKSVKTQ